MDTPLSEEVAALAATAAALIIAGLVVASARIWGLPLTAAYLTLFLGTFAMFRPILGKSFRGRATAQDDGDDGS